MNTASKIFLLNLFSLCYFAAVAQVTLEVPSQYNTIQAALDVAAENDLIEVSPGTYAENLLWPEDINGIKLIGIGGSTQTIIDGSGDGACLVMDNSNSNSTLDSSTEIRGFTIQNGGIIGSHVTLGGLQFQ